MSDKGISLTCLKCLVLRNVAALGLFKDPAAFDLFLQTCSAEKNSNKNQNDHGLVMDSGCTDKNSKTQHKTYLQNVRKQEEYKSISPTTKLITQLHNIAAGNKSAV